jgi:hypothetical protein
MRYSRGCIFRVCSRYLRWVELRKKDGVMPGQNVKARPSKMVTTQLDVSSRERRSTSCVHTSMAHHRLHRPMSIMSGRYFNGIISEHTCNVPQVLLRSLSKLPVTNPLGVGPDFSICCR